MRPAAEYLLGVLDKSDRRRAAILVEHDAGFAVAIQSGQTVTLGGLISKKRERSSAGTILAPRWLPPALSGYDAYLSTDGNGAVFEIRATARIGDGTIFLRKATIGPTSLRGTPFKIASWQ